MRRPGLTRRQARRLMKRIFDGMVYGGEPLGLVIERTKHEHAVRLATLTKEKASAQELREARERASKEIANLLEEARPA